MPFITLSEPGEPTLVMLHGTGGNEREMLAFGRQLSRRTGLLAIRGQEPENGQNRWFKRLAEGVFDEANLRYRAQELACFLEESVDQRRYGVGFSNGANMAAALLLLHPSSLNGAALISPMVPLEPSALPDLDGKPVLMVCGEHDPLVSLSNAQTLATMLQTAGADLEVHWHGGGHLPGPAELAVVASWIARKAV